MRNFQRAFFLTYNSFATADELFTLLEDLFHMEHPPAETSQENLDLALWREEKLEPMQRRVLFIMKMWFEEYGMLRDEPHVVGRLHEFLSTLTSPFIAMARVMSDSLQRHVRSFQLFLHDLFSSFHKAEHQVIATPTHARNREAKSQAEGIQERLCATGTDGGRSPAVSP